MGVVVAPRSKSHEWLRELARPSRAGTGERARWAWHPWSSERLDIEAEQHRAGLAMWLVPTFFLPLLATLLLVSAAVELAR
jgi:hypothetical protein